MKRGSHFDYLCCNCAGPEVPAAANLMTTALWHVTLYSLVDGHQYHHPADKGSMLVCNIGSTVPNYTLSHIR